MESLEEFVTATVAQTCNVGRSAVHPAASLAELGFDSLSAATLVSLVASTYGVELCQDAVFELYEASTLSDVIALLQKEVATTPLSGSPPR